MMKVCTVQIVSSLLWLEVLDQKERLLREMVMARMLTMHE